MRKATSRRSSSARSAIAERAEELRRLVAFRVTKVEVQAEADEARACLRFNEQIAAKADISYGAFVRSEPKLDGIVTAHGDTLCLDGMKHGTIYNVEVLSGFLAATGEQLREKFTTRIVVPDRHTRFCGCPDHLALHLLVDGQEERLLVDEVVLQRPSADPGRRDDRLARCTGVPLSGKEVTRRRKQRGAGRLGSSRLRLTMLRVPLDHTCGVHVSYMHTAG